MNANKLYEKHNAFIRACVTNVGIHQLKMSYSDLDDLTQEVYILLIKRLDKYDPSKSDIRSWISMQVRSRMYDEVRKKIRYKNMVKRYQKTLREPHVHNSQHVTELLRITTKHLTLSQRDMLSLKYEYGQTHKEIATALNIPIGTVKSTISRGLQKLREVM